MEQQVLTKQMIGSEKRWKARRKREGWIVEKQVCEEIDVQRIIDSTEDTNMVIERQTKAKRVRNKQTEKEIGRGAETHPERDKYKWKERARDGDRDRDADRNRQ